MFYVDGKRIVRVTLSVADEFEYDPIELVTYAPQFVESSFHAMFELLADNGVVTRA